MRKWKECFGSLATKLTPRTIKKYVGLLLILMLLASNFGYAPDVYSSNLGRISPASKLNQKVAGGTPSSSLKNKVNLLENSLRTDTSNITRDVYAGQVDTQIENPNVLNGQSQSMNQNNPNVASSIYGSFPAIPNELLIDSLKEEISDESDLNLIDIESSENQNQDIAVSDSVYKGLKRGSVASEVYSVVGKTNSSLPIRNKAGNYSVGFSRRTDMNLFEFSHKNASLIQTPVNPEFVNGKVYKNSITYEEIYPNTDLRYTVEPSRLKEEIVVKKYTDKSDFYFQLSVENAVYKVLPDSTIMFYDSASNEPLFYIPRGFAIDSNGNRCNAVSYEFTQEGLLRVSVDPNWLQQASYPVVIDPTINLFDATFSRPSVAYKQDGTQVLANLPRYEYARQASPIWSDTFDSNSMSLYTSFGSASWGINDGVLTSTGAGADAGIVKKDLILQDGEIEVVCDTAFHGGIIARYQDSGNFYNVLIQDDSGLRPGSNIELWKVVNGTSINLAGYPVSVADMAWTRGTSATIKFKINGSLLEVYFNGAKVISVTDTSLTSGGSVGLFSYSGTQRYIDLKVYQSTKGIMLEEGTTNGLSYIFASDTAMLNFFEPSGGTCTIEPITPPVENMKVIKHISTSNDSYLWARDSMNYPFTTVSTAKLAVIGGPTVTTSVWAKGDVGGEQIELFIFEYPSSGSYTHVWSQTFTLTNTWKRYEFTHELGLNTVRVWTRYDNNLANQTILWSSPQLETKRYATSFTNSTRSPETLTIPTAGVFTKGNWTVEMTFVPTSKQDVAYKYGALWDAYIDSQNLYRLLIHETGRPYFATLSGGIEYNTYDSAIPVMQVGVPYKIMVSGNGSELTFFVNGVQYAAGRNYVEPVGLLPASMGIGLGTIPPANGIIDDLRISNRARTAAEALEAYRSNQPLPVDAYTTCNLRFDGNLKAYPYANVNLFDFSRTSVAYKQDGTQVASGSPRYEAGKFSQGIIIEESTTNLQSAKIINIYNNYGPTDIETSSTVLAETFMGQQITRISYTPRSVTGLNDLRSVNWNHGAMTSTPFTYSANTNYYATIYWRSVKNSVTVNGSPSNIGGWSLFTTTDIGNGWKRSFAKYNYTVNQSDYKFWAVMDPTINLNETITVDFVAPQIEQKPYATTFTAGSRSPETLGIPTSGLIDPNQGTIEGWAYIDPNGVHSANNPNWSMPFSVVTMQYSPYAELNQISIRRWPSSNSWGVIFSNSTGASGVITLGDITTPGWYYFGVKWQQGVGGYGYLNGVLKGSVSASNLPSTFNSTANIGSWVPSWCLFDNIIDDLRFSSIARTDSEIQTNYQSNQPLPVDSFTTRKISFDGNLNTNSTASLTPTFSRPSTAFKQDGTQVASDSPRYEIGKYNQGITIEEGTTNLLTANQSSVESSLSGWYSYGAGLYRTTTEHWTGSISLVFGTTYFGDCFIESSSINVSPSTKYTYSAFVKIPTSLTSGNAWLRVIELNSAGGYVTEHTVAPNNYAPTWERQTDTFTTSPYTAKVLLRLQLSGIGTVYWDGIQLEQKPYASSWILGGSSRSTETLTIPAAGVINAKEGTLEFGIKRANTLNAYQNPFSVLIHGSANGQRFSMERSGTTNNFALATGDSIGNVIASPTFTLNPDTWYRVGVTWINGVYKVYLNGVLQPGFPWTSPYFPSDFKNSTIDVGFTNNWAGREANAIFDDFYISSVTRTDAEMQSRGISTSPLPVDANTMYKMDFDNSLLVTQYAQNLNYSTKYVYDTSNRLDYITLPSGEIIDFEYDDNGNLLKRKKR